MFGNVGARQIRDTLHIPLEALSAGDTMRVGAVAGGAVAFAQLFLLLAWVVRVPWIVALPYCLLLALPIGACVGAVVAPITVHVVDPTMPLGHALLSIVAGMFMGLAGTFAIVPNEQYAAYMYAPLGSCVGYLGAATVLAIVHRLRRGV